MEGHFSEGSCMNVSIGKRFFALVLVIALCTSAFLAIGILLLGEFDETQARILVTTGLIGFFSLLALPGGVLLDQGRCATLAWTTIGLAVFSFVVAMNLTWGDADSENLWRVAGSATAVTGAFSQSAASTSRRRSADTSGVGVLYLLSLGSVSLLGLLILTAIWDMIDHEGFYRFLGAVAVLNLLLVLLQPVARRLGGTAMAPPAERAREDIYRLAFTLKGQPSEEAVQEARQALERAGVRVEDVARLE
jgi:hypothetical protein